MNILIGAQMLFVAFGLAWPFLNLGSPAQAEEPEGG